ncbi:MAG: hypothetical protein ACOZCK_14970 [Pseudomonadota bacterium]
MVMPLVVAPHPELAPWIYHILVMPLDGCLSRLPSALSPGLLLFARGGAAQPWPTAAAGPYPVPA